MPQRHPRRAFNWTPKLIARLGKTPDSILAHQLGIPIKKVVAEREARGIGLVTGPRRWTAREIRLLGTMPDNELARRLRRTSSDVRRQRGSLKIKPFKARSAFRLWKPKELLL